MKERNENNAIKVLDNTMRSKFPSFSVHVNAKQIASIYDIIPATVARLHTISTSLIYMHFILVSH